MRSVVTAVGRVSAAARQAACRGESLRVASSAGHDVKDVGECLAASEDGRQDLTWSSPIKK